MWHRASPLLAFALALPCVLGPAPAFADPPDPETNRDTPTRIRLGLEVGAGPVFGETRGAGLGIVGALGVQFSDVFALYWQPTFAAYGWARSDDSEVFMFGSQLAMIDFTIGRAFQLGGGVGIDHGRFGFCSSGAGSCTYQDRQVQLGTEARAALIIPLPGIRARWGIPITGHFHVTWFENRQIMALLVTVGLIRY
jgi:hypothetical protein